MKQTTIQVLLALIATLASFFAPISLILYVITGLVLLDLITAVIYSIKNEGKLIKKDSWFKTFCQKIKIVKSHKIRRTVIKLFLYITVVASFYSIEIAVFTKTILLTNIVAGVIMFAEWFSICENMFKITGSSVFKKIMEKIRKPVEDKLDDLVNPLKDK